MEIILVIVLLLLLLGFFPRYGRVGWDPIGIILTVLFVVVAVWLVSALL